MHPPCLCSEEYQNLREPLEMKCPKGHYVELSYDEWRKRRICPVCLAGDPYEIKDTTPKKDPDKIRVLALDAATGTSGYSLYDGKELIKYGHYTAPPGDEVTERIDKMKNWIITLCNEFDPDRVFLEAIQLQEYNKGEFQVELYRKLANLQGVIMNTTFNLKIKTYLVLAKQWKSYCGIKGKARAEQKEETRRMVTNWYNISTTEDEADAICIGKYGCNHVGGFYESQTT